MMNTMHKPKSSKKVVNADLRAFIAGGIEGVLLSRKFVSAKDARETGNESTLETARGLSLRFPGAISERAFAGADKVMAFMGERKDAMARGTEFARSLAQEFSVARLTGVRADKAGIIVWAVKVYMDAQKEAKEAPVAPVTRSVECHAERVQAMFDKATAAMAAKGLAKLPKVVVTTENDGKVQFKVSRKGGITVTDGGVYGSDKFYGKIEGGVFAPTSACTDAVRDLIVRLANDPVGVAKASAKITSHCIFCSRKLTDGRSIAMSYGPICADTFSLPWGEERAATEVVVVEDRAA
jgi:hypothetical protein